MFNEKIKKFSTLSQVNETQIKTKMSELLQ